jgi:ABC-type multidrug transport system fused ATPase/permease subunit
VLNHGRIIETGTHTGLMDQRGFYFKLHQLQNGKKMSNED